MLVFLVEFSYMDQSTLNHFSNFFRLKYGLNYISDPTVPLGGNVRFLIGSFQPVQFKSNIRLILNDLDSYSPFIQLLSIYYDKFWFSRSQLNQVLDLIADDKNITQSQITQLHATQLALLHSILKFKTYWLIRFLLEVKAK